MSTKKYNKLVRDLIPSMLSAKGLQATYHQETGEDFERRLWDKLKEETAELIEATDQQARIEELADVLEVIAAIKQAFDLPTSAVETARKEKQAKRGGFTQGWVLTEVTDPKAA